MAAESVPGDALRYFSYIERGFYAAQLDRVLSLFRREQLLIIRHKDLEPHQCATLDRICDFLSVERFHAHPPMATVFSHAKLETPKPSADDLAYLRSLFRDDLDRLERHHGIVLEAEDGL